VFAAVYAFLPKLTGKQWYSESLANSHLWLTVIGGYGMVIPMLIQGLEGAPRRYAVLPDQFDALTQLTVPFVVMMALGQVIFAYNLVQTLRGRVHVGRETVLASFGFTASLFLGAAVIAASAFAFDEGNAGETPAQPAFGAAGGGTSNQGAQLFSSTCGSCHTLKAGNTEGTVGPNLDDVKPTTDAVLSAIQNGGLGSGTMPPGLLQGTEAQQVADFVSQNAGK
jgi:mono/diheme cytochrome c family protein